MKRKSINKKLILSKRIISSLNNNNLKNIKGGTDFAKDLEDTTTVETNTICETAGLTCNL